MGDLRVIADSGRQDGPGGAGDGDAGSPFDGLTPRQEGAIAALLAQPTVEKAAAACGVGERTLYRWLRDQAFSAAYRRARREQFAHAVSLAQRYAPASVNGLARIAADPSASHSARVAAHVAVLRFARESIELDELVGRIEALETAARQREAEEREGRWRG